MTDLVKFHSGRQTLEYHHSLVEAIQHLRLNSINTGPDLVHIVCAHVVCACKRMCGCVVVHVCESNVIRIEEIVFCHCEYSAHSSNYKFSYPIICH